MRRRFGDRRTTLLSERGGVKRRAWWATLVVIALGLIAMVGVSCDDSSSPAASPSAAASALATASPSTTVLPSAAASPAATVSPATEASSTVWLCRPGLADNPCESSLETTVVTADGTSTVESAVPAENPPIDCFYVYPTVSGQTTVNATLDIDPEVRAIAIQQASRFSQVCKVYAPVYRQLTLSAINSGTGDTPEARALAYGDVLGAWKDYLANYNDGRGIVLIGHSQGTLMLTHLITTEIDSDPSLRSLLVSALLIGGNVLVAAGKDAGGDFQNVPACRSADQTGCVAAYSSFDMEPPPNASFGRADSGPHANELTDGNLQVLCVNPASLSGETVALLPYFGTAKFPGPIGLVLPTAPPATTPWLFYPDLYTGTCESVDGADWLNIDTTGIDGDNRPVVYPTLGPASGLHLFDVNLALGNLVELVRQQAAAFKG